MREPWHPPDPSDPGTWVELTGVLEAFAERCVGGVDTATQRTEFEHVREAATAFLLLRGHTTVLSDLVLKGPHTYPSGWPIARSMFEVAVRSAWRMDPADPYEAEARWVQFARGLAAVRTTEARWLTEQGNGGSAQRAREQAEAVTHFCDQVATLLRRRGIEVPEKHLSVPKVLKELGLEDRYWYYQTASERQHGALVGLDAYTRDLGTGRVHGYFATMLDWLRPLTMAITGLKALAETYISRAGADPATFGVGEAVSDWDEVLRRLRGGPSPA